MQLNQTHVTDEQFQLGKVVITKGALTHCEDNNVDHFEMLIRHAVGDFGTIGSLEKVELTVEERVLGSLATDNGLKLNAIAIESKQGMIMSAYPTLEHQNSKIWIQTILAGDDTYTTILLPSEY